MIGGVRVKICGLTNADDMRHAVAAGADYVGVVFADSPRRVDTTTLGDWLDDARDLCEVVGVFRDASFEEVLDAVERFDLDFVQLHGTESGGAWSTLPVRLIETRIADEHGVAPVRFAGSAWAELLDGGAGTGSSFPWRLAVEPAKSTRLFLAGGLDAQNVGEAVRRVHPFAVDVSSGVETVIGSKDAAKVTAFIKAAKEAMG